MTALVLLLSAVSSPAHAWKHIQTTWERDAMPLPWYTGAINEDSLADDYEIDVLITSWENWEEQVPCAQLSQTYEGVREDYTRTKDTNDNKITFQYDDPDDIIGSGTLGVTWSNGQGGFAFNLSGQAYYYNTDADIAFNDDVSWATSDDIRNGNCNGQGSIEGVATHEIGHLWGLGHSCDEGESCTDPDLLNATMYWTGGSCSLAQATPKDDDIEGMNFLYGPSASFSTEDEVAGGAPLEVCFDLESNDAVTDVEWNFGDGSETVTELSPCHTYEEHGQYTVWVTMGGEGDCGEWEYSYREIGMITVCGEPAPGIGEDGQAFEGLFTYEHYDGLQYQMLNQTDTSVYGCVDNIQWDVFQGETLIDSVQAWSPRIEFPEEGDYRVVLNVGGPGGVSAAELNVTAVDTKVATSACATVPAAAGLASALFGLGLVGLRRRRQD